MLSGCLGKTPLAHQPVCELVGFYKTSTRTTFVHTVILNANLSNLKLKIYANFGV